MERSYAIEGMHCEGCVEKIGKALQAIPGVISARVSLHPPKVDVSLEDHVPLVRLQTATQEAGEYSLQELDFTTKARLGNHQSAAIREKESLYPLLLILAYLAGVVALVGWPWGRMKVETLMSMFMGGFFLIFSFFKLLNLRGFADAYRSYDVLAKALPGWGYAYPFIELGLGIAYIVYWNPFITNMATLILMLIGSIGVLKALSHKSAIRCACLGTVLNLPMTKVTLIEDLGMAAMAASMLIYHR